MEEAGRKGGSRVGGETHDYRNVTEKQVRSHGCAVSDSLGARSPGLKESGLNGSVQPVRVAFFSLAKGALGTMRGWFSANLTQARPFWKPQLRK